MNNVVLGNARFGYYETIAGGQGACPDGDGPSAVHVAMSNTLNTPVEVLEREYPLRVERYAIRRGSGGDGRHRGGDGVLRAIRVLEDCRLSVISERRRRRPRGAAGGEDGAVGENRLNGRRHRRQAQPRAARRRRARDPHARRRRPRPLLVRLRPGRRLGARTAADGAAGTRVVHLQREAADAGRGLGLHVRLAGIASRTRR